jgi:FkbM family methyltransferase
MMNKNYDLAALRSLCENCGIITQPALSREKPIVIFGAGNFGKDLSRIFTSSGFVVSAFLESESKSMLVQDIPVYNLTNIPENLLSAQLVIGIFNRSAPYKEIQESVNSKKFKNIFFPWHIYEKFSNELGWRFWLSGPKIHSENQRLIENAFSKLADDQSREIFHRIIKFRAGQDLDFSEFISKEDQYFNEITLNSKHTGGINFVDCGAYNGDTFNELAGKYKIESAYLFEPDPENFKKLVSNVSSLGIPALCLPLAVSDKYEILSFSGEIGEGSLLSAEGKLRVAAVSLDDLLQFKKIDFLKFDVEGGECAAIKGAQSLIKKSNPVLAVSLYHKPSDLWEIPLLIDSISNNYKFYIRQHWHNSFDSVLYALPN